jgi:rRNA maturation protein Nop10
MPEKSTSSGEVVNKSTSRIFSPEDNFIKLRPIKPDEPVIRIFIVLI